MILLKSIEQNAIHSHFLLSLNLLWLFVIAQFITHAVLDAVIDNEAKKMRIIGYFLLLLFGIFGGF